MGEGGSGDGGKGGGGHDVIVPFSHGTSISGQLTIRCIVVTVFPHVS